MKNKGWLRRVVCGLLVMSLIGWSVPPQAVRAAWVETESVLGPSAADSARARLEVFLARQDVQTELQAHGIDPREACRRAAGLSDAEILRVADRIPELPAGGNALGVIVGAGLLVFIVLLVTDILGLTHVFPFVTRRH
jgi:hypothetical protein